MVWTANLDVCSYKVTLLRTKVEKINAGSSQLLEKAPKTLKYPEARVIVLNDDVNTFEHVAKVLTKIIPGMSEDKAWKLANKIDTEGKALVWSGPLEQAELYHHQLANEGLTMAPIERC